LRLSPFFTYYFGGTPVRVDSPTEAASALAAGRADYLAVDSLTVQRLTPGLRGLITATAPVGGASLVYRRYSRDDNRLTSVYQRGAAELRAAPASPRAEDAGALLAVGQRYLKDGYIEHARQVLLAAEAANPEESQTHYELYTVYLISGNYDCSCLDLAEAQLLKYSYLAPYDPNLGMFREFLQASRMRCVAEWGKE
jgi:hypothetical protein